MRIGKLFPCLGRDVEPKKEAKLEEVEVKPRKDFEVQEPPLEPEKGSLWLQWLSALSASFALMGCGGHMGWTSPALPHLTGPDSDFPVTAYQGSWIASIYILGSILGSLLSPVLVDRLGRKRSLLVFAIPQLVGWALIVPARSYVVLYVARFVAGISHGGVYNVSVIYLAEIADKRVRGAFGSILKTSTNIGTLFSATAGAYLPYNQLNLVSLLLPFAFLTTFIFAPESPYFYLMHGHDDNAGKELLRLRRMKRFESVRDDLETMRLAVVEGQRTRGGMWELFSKPSNRRGLWILFSLKMTQQLSGQMAIVAYTQEIFSYSGSNLAPKHAVIVLGLVQLAAGFVAAALVDKVGRRLLILCSGCSASFALCLVGSFFYAKFALELDVSVVSWVPIVGLMLFEITVALGIGTVPYVILGEIFPTNVKGFAVASGIIVGSMFAFVVGLGFQALNAAVGIHMTFWFFAVCCCTGSIWIYVITPETKGKTLEEVQALFDPPSKKKDAVV